MLIAQLSDCHIATPEEDFTKLYQPADRLREAIRHVNTSLNRPDLVFLTGDLINSGKREEYDILRDLIAGFEMPVYLLPGNHDNCALLREVFPDHDYLPPSGDLNYVVDGWPLKIICLDTNLHGKPEGFLGEAQLDWLDQQLTSDPTRRAVIFMHHPPFLTGLAKMDGMGLLDREAFNDIIARHDNVERVLCGHVHRAIQKLAGGTLVQTCPSTSHQIMLHLGEKGELGTVFEPPEYLLHYWTEEAGFLTHTDYVKDYDIAWTLKDGVK
tara:strand:- start:27 stop:833 length:807 start_codon:yes stop_codon:yes gene_type:complete